MQVTETNAKEQGAMCEVRTVPILIPFPQFNQKIRNSSMQIYYENVVLGLEAAGLHVVAISPDSYASSITSNGSARLWLRWTLRKARRFAGWIGEYWLFLLLYTLWNGRPTIVAISQEYCPLLASKNSVVIVHDLIQLSYPRSKPVLYYYRLLIRLLRNKRIITVSETSREKLAQFGLPSTVVYNEFTQPDTSLSEPKVFDAIWIGTKAPHKDLETYLEAARHQPGLTFAILCPGASQLNIREPNVRTFENLSDAEVQSLNARSWVFVSTSLEEGYGRPAMEARLQGMPLVLSDITVHQELHSGVATFFKPGDGIKLGQLIAGRASLAPTIQASAHEAWTSAAAKFARPGALVEQVSLLLSANRI